ncbi:hypothetical protein LEMLEM_LOCUS13132, partial [Lemmus lemmus]
MPAKAPSTTQTGSAFTGSKVWAVDISFGGTFQHLECPPGVAGFGGFLKSNLIPTAYISDPSLSWHHHF